MNEQWTEVTWARLPTPIGNAQFTLMVGQHWSAGFESKGVLRKMEFNANGVLRLTTATGGNMETDGLAYVLPSGAIVENSKLPDDALALLASIEESRARTAADVTAMVKTQLKVATPGQTKAKVKAP